MMLDRHLMAGGAAVLVSIGRSANARRGSDFPSAPSHAKGSDGFRAVTWHFHTS